MDALEVWRRRRNAEEEIKKIIFRFECDTGIRVTNIQYRRIKDRARDDFRTNAEKGIPMLPNEFRLYRYPLMLRVELTTTLSEV